MIIGKYIELSGIVSEGSKSSSSWMPDLIPSLFPGTLNIVLENYRPDINYHTYIPVNNNPLWNYEDCFIKIGSCLINSVEAFIIMPPNYKYLKKKYLLEVGHEKNLRKYLNLNTGDVVNVKFTQNSNKL
jgi:CTP-dependent riboflavin kinase